MDSGTMALNPSVVDPREWQCKYRRDLDGAFGKHTLKRALDVLTCLTRVADGEKDCPKSLLALFNLRGSQGDHYRNMFGRAFFSQAREFVRGLRNRLRELEQGVRGTIQRYANRQRPFWKFVPTLRCRRAFHPA